ncbi:MAG: hypothetical protein AAFP86_16340, partial [Planctomycetota bacterium]
SQKRRAADERERDAKRADARRTTQLWLGRIGGGVGSLWSGLRGEDSAPGTESVTRSEAAVVPFDRRPPPPAHEPLPEGGGPDRAALGLEQPVSAAAAVEPGAADLDPRPGVELPGAEREGVQGEGPEAAPRDATGALFTDSAAAPPEAHGSSDAADPVESAPAAGESPAFEAGAAERRAEREAVEAALRSNGDTAFALPITGRVFAAVAAVLLGVVFALGFRLGSGDPAEAAAPADATGSRGLARIELSAPPAGSGAADGQAGAARVPAPAGAAFSGSARAAGTGRSGSAAAGSAAAGAAAPDPAKPGAAAARAADAAFDDPHNRYSILAVTYAATRTNEKLAWEAFDQLAAAGLPVVSPVLDSADRKIFLFVGAAEAEAQLRPLLNDVKAVETGPRRARDFMSAWVVLIDHYR